MATTCKLIGKAEAGSGGAATFTFNSIPATYTDLWLLISSRSEGSAAQIQMKLNNITSGYSYRSIFGDGSTAASYSGSGDSYFRLQYSTGTNQTANTFSSIEVYIPNYAGSTAKSVSITATMENNATSSNLVPMAGLQSSTAAITDITLTQDGADFAQYSTAYLYGITKA